jgi:hypothetical protein
MTTLEWRCDESAHSSSNSGDLRTLTLLTPLVDMQRALFLFINMACSMMPSHADF